MPDEPRRWRVTSSRVMEGYELKASWLYEAGEILDREALPPGHFDRLLASGAIEPVVEAAAAGEVP